MTAQTLVGLALGWASLLGTVLYTAGRMSERLDGLRKAFDEHREACHERHALVDATLRTLETELCAHCARAKHAL